MAATYFIINYLGHIGGSWIPLASKSEMTTGNKRGNMRVH